MVKIIPVWADRVGWSGVCGYSEREEKKEKGGVMMREWNHHFVNKVWKYITRIKGGLLNGLSGPTYKQHEWTNTKMCLSPQRECYFASRRWIMHRAAATGEFTPPLKNNIYTVGVKTISKTSFLRSMGSPKKSASYGAWEAHFWVFQPLRSETTTFFSAGVKNDKLWFPRCMRSKKKCFLRSMGSWFFIFATPLGWY